MIEFLRLSLLLVLAGSALTALAALFAWYAEEHRRLGRAFRRVLGAAPDAELVAHGQGRAAAFRLAGGVFAVAWDAGAWCLVYRLEELVGAELTIDGQVAARAFRGEPRRPLDHRPKDAQAVNLRLIFDDPQHPDFDLPLWPPSHHHRRGPENAGRVIQEANRWLARVEAVLRRAAVPQPQFRRPEASEPPPPQAPAAHPSPTARAPSMDEAPPWDDEGGGSEEEDDLRDEGPQGRLL